MPLGLLLAAGLGYAVFHFYVPMYESSALILIEDQAPYIAYETRVAGGTHMSDRYLQTQIELLRSDVVLGPVLARPEIASLKEFEQKPDRLAHIKEHLSIRQVGKSELYNVQYVSPSRDAAERIANAVVEVYLNIQSTDDSRRTNSVIKVLDEQATQRADEVRILRNKVTELAKEVTGRDPFAGGVAIELTSLHPPEAIYNNLVELEVEREMMAAELQAVKESAMATATHEDASGLIDLAVESNDEIKARQQQITELQAAMEAFQATSVRRDWQSSAEYQQMTRSLEVAKETLPKRQEEIRRELLAKRTQELNTRNEAEIARIESELRKLNAKAKLLEEKYAEHRGERKESGATSAELEFQRSELERKTGVLEMIEARRLALRTEQRAPARHRVGHVHFVEIEADR